MDCSDSLSLSLCPFLLLLPFLLSWTHCKSPSSPAGSVAAAATKTKASFGTCEKGEKETTNAEDEEEEENGSSMIQDNGQLSPVLTEINNKKKEVNSPNTST